ncbi:NAD(P)H-dependent oxidoreductase [Xylophilus sp.]|uniref:NAD(P)H-dependent oxidoreductase n=1 Tax=Xylophilus sp. TaxID=2653893 RepID=UPI0013BD1613|nr:NAD(P)H-dependent oxidoreductase [Xylophilus sp.]KAF1046969.1 MAG: FMN reductase (NADPH) [Xylophilus sp.]
MTVLLIAGGPSQRSRSGALLDAVGQRVGARGGRVGRIDVAALPPQALVEGDAAHRSLALAIDQVAAAQAVVLATPVQRASYGGLLKLFIDLLPQAAFRGKTVLPLGTAGTAAQAQGLDEAFRPVLLSLGTEKLLPGIYAADAEVALTPEGAHLIGPRVAQRLDHAAGQLAGWAAAGEAIVVQPSPSFAPAASMRHAPAGCHA